MAKYCYLRVSTIDQNLDRQYEAMKKYDIPEENYFVEKISGKNTDRPELQRLFATIQEGDTIHIHDFSRLSRSTSDLLHIVEDLNKKGVHLVSNKENLDTSTPTGKLMLTMIAAIYEFERTNTLERSKEGIRLAKQRGAYNKKDIDIELAKKLKIDVDKGIITVKDAAKQLGFSRQYWYRYIRKINEFTEAV